MMKKVLAMAAVLMMAMSYSGATLAQQVYLLAPDAAGNSRAMEKRAAKEGKRAEKMMAKEKAGKLSEAGSFDEDSAGSEDEESAASSDDEESAASSDDGSSDTDAKSDGDSDSGDEQDMSRRERAEQTGSQGLHKAQEMKESNKARQAEKREMVEEYKSLSKEERDALAESGGDETNDKKKAKKPWWKFWDK
ncbi:MAG: hypothetical protein HKN59_06160 [Gammaproteobacteria bacterium]|nr:hypothetical protein [Gammaproteobacteria bacterium]